MQFEVKIQMNAKVTSSCGSCVLLIFLSLSDLELTTF